MKVGITFSTFDLFHAGHVAMLEEAKTQCDWLIAAIQIDPSVDRPEKNKPVQSLIERQLQVRGCKFVDETLVYATEQDVIDILTTLPIDIRILGEEYKNKSFTGDYLDIPCYFNRRRHNYSSSGLRKRVYNANGDIKV